jgi:hypothetical protein
MFVGVKPKEADIEDLLDPAVYDGLVKDCYAAEIESGSVKLNPHIPRIVKRYEMAFEAAGLKFNKTRPARIWLEKMSKAPGSVFGADAQTRFATLFEAINTRFEKQGALQARPFNSGE